MMQNDIYSNSMRFSSMRVSAGMGQAKSATVPYQVFSPNVRRLQRHRSVETPTDKRAAEAPSQIPSSDMRTLERHRSVEAMLMEDKHQSQIPSTDMRRAKGPVETMLMEDKHQASKSTSPKTKGTATASLITAPLILPAVSFWDGTARAAEDVVVSDGAATGTPQTIEKKEVSVSNGGAIPTKQTTENILQELQIQTPYSPDITPLVLSIAGLLFAFWVSNYLTPSLAFKSVFEKEEKDNASRSPEQTSDLTGSGGKGRLSSSGITKADRSGITKGKEVDKSINGTKK